MTQNRAVLNYLESHSGITSKQAFEIFGITRLSARISDLRGEGYNISTINRDGLNRWGHKTRYAEYRLVKR